MLNESGYKRRTYDDIVNSKIQKAKELFGEDIETDETTVLGKFIRINAYDQALAEEEAEAIYYSRYPHTASGVSLDRVCTFVGISRNSATPAQYEVKAVGTAGAVIPIGFLVQTESEIKYYSVAESEIGADGMCVFKVECTEPGTIGNVMASDINTITNPSADIEKIEGRGLIKAGTDDESDYSLRKRFDEAKTGLGACNSDSIRTALLRVPTVESVSVIVNEEDEPDEKGRPPHSFECYISGGESHHLEIVQAIYEKKPLGIKSYGTETYSVLDAGGHPHTIKFSHCTSINVIVNIKFKKNINFNLVTGEDDIKSNVANYINELGVGNNVILSSLYGQIHAVTGVVEVVELLIGVQGELFSAQNIEVNGWEIAQCASVELEEVT